MKLWRSWYKEIQPSNLKNKNKTIDVEMIKKVIIYYWYSTIS